MNTASQQAPQRRITVIPANPQLTEKDIRKKHLRVAPYCRVSTDSEEQLNSYNAQIAYYTEKIAAMPEWTMVRLYADEGISGTSMKQRKEFMKMLRDCDRGKIDLVITKSVSRFGRNTLDGLDTVRKLKRKGIGVFFEKKDLWTRKAPEYCGILAPFSGNWCLVGVQTYAENRKEITRNDNYTEKCTRLEISLCI